MGYKLLAASRAKLFDGCYELQERMSSRAVVIDACSEGRRIGNSPVQRSAKSIAFQLCKNMWKRGDSVFVLLFDDSSRMHKERDNLHAERYKSLPENKLAAHRAMGKLIVGGRPYTPGSEPYTKERIAQCTVNTKLDWRRVWSSGHGKEFAFESLRVCVIEWHHANAAENTVAVVQRKGKAWYYPYDSDDAKAVAAVADANTFGEADNKAAEMVKHLAVAGTCTMQTVDTDMLLQMLASKTAHTWHSVMLRLLNETVNVAEMVKRFGGSNYEERLSSVFWMLCCNGVDYCKGLTRFGFTTNDLLSLIGKHNVVHLALSGERAVLDTRHVMQALRSIKRKNMKQRMWEDFNNELNAIVFSLSLFTGACYNAEPAGGPVMRTEAAIDSGCDVFESASFMGVGEGECSAIEFDVGI